MTPTPDAMDNELPAGKYWIGDPCYVLGRGKHEDWIDVLNKTNYFDGDVYTIRGSKLWGHGTAYGDGTYTDKEGREYGVDAGILSVIPWKLVEDKKKADTLGHVVTFDAPFECRYDSGILHMGHISIDTEGSSDEEQY